MSPEMKVVAGLSCADVLERLSDFVDGELSRAEVERIETHLRGCDACERFGGEFSAVVKAARRRLMQDAPLDEERLSRLKKVLGSQD